MRRSFLLSLAALVSVLIPGTGAVAQQLRGTPGAPNAVEFPNSRVLPLPSGRFAGVSAYPHHGQRVVMGQRLMQPTSDIFLGWVSANGVPFYVRQLRDAKIKPLIETFDEKTLEIFAKATGSVLARAYAKAGGVSQISGYLGAGDAFDEAVGRFGLAYADQTERDHTALKAAVRRGKVRVMREA